MPIEPGTKVGPYEIVGWLGAGAMGEVYRARDPRLGRDVAIKVIPAAFASDRMRLQRFEQEARAAGQLNHPNILAVYDVGANADAPYIVSELLEGQPLRQCLLGGALTSRKAIDYAGQIAQGLSAAHDKGIVHRDLKPDNLFVTSDGRVKILDFGIAKLIQPTDDATRGADRRTLTDTGTAIGTPGYMSPEQVRGEAVDHRSDIFSFGAILYEMLSGRPAFIRNTAADTMAAILTENSIERLPSTVAPALERVVWRCLEKTREARFQSARDLAFGLEVLSGISGTASPGVSRAAASRWRVPAAIAAVALSLAAAVTLWLTRGISVPVDNPLANARVTPITDWPGTESGAEISPDGKFVVFLADRDGETDLWWGQAGTEGFRNLTADLPPLSEFQYIMRAFGFTGDGTEVWFSAGPRRMLMPQTGGPARPFLGRYSGAIAWSPDGARTVFLTTRPNDVLSVADHDGTNAQPIEIKAVDPRLPPKDVHNHNPIWSVDGQWIYFVRGVARALNWTDEMDVWRVRPSGASPERLTHQQTAVTFLAPIDERTLLYSARAVDGSGPWLWALDVPTKATRQITFGIDQDLSVAASRDGRRVVATVARPSSSLSRVPLSDGVEERDVQPYAVPTARPFAPRFGGTSSLFYLAASGMGDRLWRWKDGQALEVLKNPDSALSEPVAVSRDGNQIAVVLRKEGKQRLTIASADGSESRTLAPSIDVLGAAAWSPDASWIAIGGQDAQGPALFMIPVKGGPPVRLVNGWAVNPIWSLDGTLIVYSGPVDSGQVELFGVRPDGSPAQLPSVKVRPGGYKLLRDGTGVVYLPRSSSQDFFRLDFATGTSTQITKLSKQGVVSQFDIDPDGKFIVFDRLRENSDIVLFDLPVRK